MRTPHEGAAGHGAAVPRTARDARVLVHLRLHARVASCGDRVLLVGDGHGVEFTDEGATRVRAHSELVELPADTLAGGPAGPLWAQLTRARALDRRVSVDLVEVRGPDGTALPDRQIAITDDADITLHYREPQG